MRNNVRCFCCDVSIQQAHLQGLKNEHKNDQKFCHSGNDTTALNKFNEQHTGLPPCFMDSLKNKRYGLCKADHLVSIKAGAGNSNMRGK